MTDAQFYNGFVFRRFDYNRYHTTDNTKNGSIRHYFAKLVCGTAKLQCANFTVELKAGDVFYIPYRRVVRIIRTRLKAMYYGAFHPFFFDGRQPICRKEEQKSPQIRRL